MLPIMPIADMATPEQLAVDALFALHTRTTDTLSGYDKMLEKAEPEFRPTVERFRALHVSHAAGIAAILTAKGYAVDGEGSIMGAINRTVVAIRALFDNVDTDLMTAIRDGEEHVLAAFAEALTHPMPKEDLNSIRTMRDELTLMLAQSPAPV